MSYKTRGLTSEQERVLAGLRYQLAAAVLEAHWSRSRRDQELNDARVDAHAQSISLVLGGYGYTSGDTPYTTPYLDVRGRLDSSDEALARDLLGDEAGHLMGASPEPGRRESRGSG